MLARSSSVPGSVFSQKHHVYDDTSWVHKSMHKINWKHNTSKTYFTCQLEHCGNEMTDAPGWLLMFSAWNWRVNFLNPQHIHLLPSQLQVCYRAVFLTPPNLLGPEPLSNMFSITNLVKMEAARHPSDLLHAQAQPCSVHLHIEPSCCRAQKVRHTQQLTSRGLMCTGSPLELIDRWGWQLNNSRVRKVWRAIRGYVLR